MNAIISNLTEIIITILAAVISFIGTKLKNMYSEHIKHEMKNKIVKTVCEAVEQLYSNLPGEEKLKKAQDYVKEMLKEKNLSMTDLEMQLLIESNVKQLESLKP